MHFKNKDGEIVRGRTEILDVHKEHYEDLFGDDSQQLSRFQIRRKLRRYMSGMRKYRAGIDEVRERSGEILKEISLDELIYKDIKRHS